MSLQPSSALEPDQAIRDTRVEAPFVRLRGRVVADVDFAWLEVGGDWECSSDPAFELVAADGTRVRVTSDPDCDWHWLCSSYSGPWSQLEEHDWTHPFRDQEHADKFTRYARVQLRRDAALDVWGIPTYAAARGTYRQSEKGALESVAAVRVRRDYGDGENPLSRFVIAGVLASGALALAAPFTRAPMLVLRCALLMGLATARVLHHQASPLAPPRPRPKHPMLRSLAITWFWAYLGVAFVLPMAGSWARITAAAMVALVLARWGVTTLRERRPEIARTLLSKDAVDGFIQGDRVRTTAVTLGPDDFAVTWAERLAESAFEHAGNDSALAAPLGEKWALVRAFAPSVRATLRRAQTWDRVMPWVYFAMGALALVAASSRL